MLKKDFDKIKKRAKQQQALQQAMLELATANINQPTANVLTVEPALKFPGFSCPFVWGTALVIFLLVVIL